MSKLQDCNDKTHDRFLAMLDKRDKDVREKTLAQGDSVSTEQNEQVVHAVRRRFVLPFRRIVSSDFFASEGVVPDANDDAISNLTNAVEDAEADRADDNEEETIIRAKNSIETISTGASTGSSPV